MAPRHAPLLPAGDAASSTTACSLGTLAPVTGVSVSYIMPFVTYAHAESTCGRDVARVVDQATCAVNCGAGNAVSNSTAACSVRTVGSLNCDPSPCIIGFVSNVKADSTCGGRALELRRRLCGQQRQRGLLVPDVGILHVPPPLYKTNVQADGIAAAG